MTQQQTTGFAILGTGMVADYHRQAIEAHADKGARLIAVGHYDPAQYGAIGERFGVPCRPFDELLADPAVDAVCICTPSGQHAAQTIAAAEAGKHVLCEKPLANTLGEAQDMLTAARKAGTINMINFNYRRVPAVQLTKRLIDDGTLGEIRHFRACYLQDWIMDPQFPLAWRLQKELAGSGALGDIGAHVTDLAMFLVGPIREVVGSMETFIKQRPIEVESTGGSGLSAQSGQEMGEVTVDDATSFLARFENGAMGTFEASRLAGGRRNQNTFEINGSKGSLRFNLERFNELEVYWAETGRTETRGFTDVLVSDADHPFWEHWWPQGHIIGWEHTFVHEFAHLLDAIVNDKDVAPLGATFEDGYRNAVICDAILQSAAEGRRVEISYGG